MSDPDDDSKLRRQLNDLRQEVDALRHQVGELPERRELERRHREQSDAVSEARRHLDDRIDELEHDLDDRIHALSSKQEQARAILDRRLRSVERHARASNGVPTVQLDPTPDLIELAQRAERGRTLSAQLLEPHSRAVKKNAVTAWETWQNQHRTHSAAALAASRTIAGTAPGEPGRHAAESAYQAARAALTDLATRRDRTRQTAAAATQQLTRDDTLRRTHTAAIAQGKQAWTTLTTRLRTQLTDTIRRSELLPVWFDTVLGMTPPPDASQWLEAGTELLAYRTTYGIDDPVVALGSSPGADSSDRRREWHRTLTNQLRAYH